MATIPILNKTAGVVLGTSQTGNVTSTNAMQRRGTGPAALVLASVAGTTVKVDIQGSADGTNFFNVPYALVATPSTFVVAQITTTTTTTVTYLLQTDQPWKYLQVVYSSNTGMSMTATAFAD